tara:strand:- start:1865 stop:2350 length:486 start_codon:yes stop_codon:yes gene_type:complete
MIKRYECFTEWGGTNYDATPTDDGPWVRYEDHAEAMQKLWHTAYTRENVNSEALATLRAEVERWVKKVAHLKLAAEKAEREKALFDAATDAIKAEVWDRDHGGSGVMDDSDLAMLHEALEAHPLNKAEIGEEEIAVLRAITEHWEKAVAHLPTPQEDRDDG